MDITSSFLYQWITNVITSLWSESPGQVFTVTVLSYLIGYLIYGGYLSRFAGKGSSIPFGLIDFSITDLIALFPTAVLTSANIAVNGTKKLLLFLIFKIALPIIAGLVLGRLALPFFSRLSLPDIIGIIGIAMWIIGFWIISIFPQVLRLRKFSTLGVVLQVLGIALITVTANNRVNASSDSNSTSTISIPYPIELIAKEIITFSALFTLPIALVLFGREMAEIAAKEKMLSQVTRIAFKQPIPGLGTMQESNLAVAKLGSWKHHWLIKSSLPVTIEPDVYICIPEKPLYLLASSRNMAAFYIADENAQNITGQMILVSRELIYSMEIEIPKHA